MNKIHIKSDAKYIDIHHNNVVNVDISTKEPVSDFDKHIQQGDEIIVGEDGSRVNISQLKRIAKKREPVSEELEEAAKITAAATVLNGMAPDATIKQLREVAVMCFKVGSNWQKEQMMKDAVEVSVVNVANMASESQDICGKYFSCVGSFKEDEYCPSLGDKVKLIIIKEN